MKFILGLSLFIPLSSFSATCSDLEKYAKTLEQKVNSGRVLDCKELSPPEGMQEEEKKFFEQYKCLPFSDLDNTLKSYDHDLAMIQGIDFLKNDIAQNASQILENQDVSENSNKLIKNVQLATHLEFLLDKGKSSIDVVKQSSNPEEYKANCLAKYKKDASHCERVLAQENLDELKSFYELYENSHQKDKDLKEALSLAKHSEFTFEEISEKLKLTQRDSVTLKLLQTIGTPPKGTAAQTPDSKFQDFTGELLKRQQWQKKSIYTAYAAQLTIEQKNKCDIDKMIEGNSDCLIINGSTSEATSKGLLASAQSQLKNYDDSEKKYLKIIDQCQVPLSSECETLKKDLEDKYRSNTAAIIALSELRNRFTEENKALITFRNYSLEQLHVNECPSVKSVESSIDYCPQATETASAEVIQLVLDGGKILASLSKPDSTPMDLSSTCSEKREKKVSYEDELCNHFEADGETDPDQPLITTPNPVDNSNMYVQPRSSSLGDATNNLISTIAGLFAPKQNFNPYQISGPPRFPMGTGTGPSAQIIGSHMMYGFGSYQSTPGLRPYSSIDSDVGKSSAYNFGNSGYFYKPIGW